MAASVSGSSGVTADELAPRHCAQYTAPPLSSYAIDLHELVYAALTTLTDAIARDRHVRRHVLLSTELVRRESLPSKS